VNIIGAWAFALSWASGTVPFASPPFGVHWDAPAGLFVSSHSYPNRFSKYPFDHRVGVEVQAPSRPLVIVSPALPLPNLFFHPRPCSSRPAASGSGPTFLSGGAAPWALPNVCPPAIRATVSSSFIAIRLNVSRMSRAAASGSGLPFGPSGLT
jgi:hypothetical protein